MRIAGDVAASAPTAVVSSECSGERGRGGSRPLVPGRAGSRGTDRGCGDSGRLHSSVSAALVTGVLSGRKRGLTACTRYVAPPCYPPDVAATAAAGPSPRQATQACVRGRPGFASWGQCARRTVGEGDARLSESASESACCCGAGAWASQVGVIVRSPCCWRYSGCGVGVSWLSESQYQGCSVGVSVQPQQRTF